MKFSNALFLFCTLLLSLNHALIALKPATEAQLDNRKTHLMWGSGLAAAAMIGTFFSYKFFKSWRAEENKFDELSDSLKTIGARISRSIYDNGFVIEHSLRIEPKEQMSEQETEKFDDYSNQLIRSFHDRDSAQNLFFTVVTPTVLAAIFSAASFSFALKSK